MHGLSDRQLLVFLLQFTILLAAARLLGAVARRFGQPSAMGEVLAGVVLGPTMLGHVPGVEGFVFPKDPRQAGLLELLSWIGMILLMLRTGIDTDLSRWRTLKGPALLASICGIAFPFAVGIGTGFVVPGDLVGRGGRPLFAIFLATATPRLKHRRRGHREHRLQAGASSSAILDEAVDVRTATKIRDVTPACPYAC